MAKARFRGVSDDERRYPNFEGIGPGFAGGRGGNAPGSNRGNIGGAGFAFPVAQTGQTRLQGLQASGAEKARAMARSAGTSTVQGGGTMGTGKTFGRG